MTGRRPAAEAVEAVADAIATHDTRGASTLSRNRQAAGALLFIRDAIHRDGDDADAIREALGLRVIERAEETMPLFVVDGRLVYRGRRVVGEWLEVQK